MIIVGIDTLGNLNDQAESRDALGLAFWRIVICSGIFIFIMGWINLAASFVFCDRKQGITARQVRAHGAVAALKSPSVSHGTPSVTEMAQSHVSNPYVSNPRTPTKSGNAFRIVAAERRRSILPPYKSSSPSTANSTVSREKEALVDSPTSRYSRATACSKKKIFGIMGRNRDSLAPPLPVNASAPRPMEISAPLGVNPQFAHLVQRPDSALHPSRTGESQAFRWAPV